MRASILVLLIAILFIVGVLWFLRSSEEPKSLEVVPQVEGKSLIQFASTDKDKVKIITSAIEDALKRKLKIHNVQSKPVFIFCSV